MPSSLGPAEILVILVVALIVLGPAKLPQAGRQVGKALSELRRWTTDVKSEVKTAFDVEAALNEKPPSYDDYPDSMLVQQAAAPAPAPDPEPPRPVDLTKPADRAASTPSSTAEPDRL
ncbi:MAG: Sec-independent protein translocase subunit TatA/TatB [Acidimicrobiales bacterium]